MVRDQRTHFSLTPNRFTRARTPTFVNQYARFVMAGQAYKFVSFGKFMTQQKNIGAHRTLLPVRRWHGNNRANFL